MSKLQALIEAQRKSKEESNVKQAEIPVPTAGVGGFKPKFSPASKAGTSELKPATSLATTSATASRLVNEGELREGADIANVSESAEGYVLSLDDLDSLSESAGLDESTGVDGYLFVGREKVTAPDRSYDFELNESQQGFVGLLDGIYEVLNDAPAFGSMIRTIMLELQENGEYRRLLADSDVNAMMRGLRDSMGMARIKKTEKTKGRSAAPASKRQNQVLEALDGLGFDASDLDD